MSLKAITLHQPWATMCVLPSAACTKCRDTGKMGVTYQTDYGTGVEHDLVDCDSCPDPIKTIETRSWRAPADLIGQRIAIHAGTKRPEPWSVVGGYQVQYDGLGNPMLIFGEPYEDVGEGVLHGVPLDLGAIVGTAVLYACIPMLDPSQLAGQRAHLAVTGRHDPEAMLLCWPDVGYHGPGRNAGEHFEFRTEDVRGQRPYGWFASGRFAWVLDDARSTYELCPVCLGADVVCARCMGERHCPPVPARGFQRVWTWTPDELRDAPPATLFT